MKVFVDNVAAQAVEACLLTRLSEILSPTSILEMDADLITAIAGEPEESQVEREQLTRKLAVLKSGLDICKRYASRPTRDTAHKVKSHNLLVEDEELPILEPIPQPTPQPKTEEHRPSERIGNATPFVFKDPFNTDSPPSAEPLEVRDTNDRRNMYTPRRGRTAR